MQSAKFYRREVDGLRALAVVPVMLFHGQVPGFAGGFIGVDIFFVISGYLITSLLYREHVQHHRVSLRSFYMRRARRILPALFLVMMACCAMAWTLMLPSELKYFAKSTVFVIAFSSNFLFSNNTGYFDPTGEDVPLLHTWSLAVEEQFYLFFPIVFIAAMKVGVTRTRQILLVLTVASLLVAEITVAVSPSEAFYLLPSRFWELGCGSLLALNIGRIETSMGWKQNLSILGIAILAACLLLFDEKTPHPGVVTVFPVLGAILVIAYATQETAVGRILSAKPLVGIGLVSYSAYLWHQPLFAFARMTSEHAGSTLFSGGVILLSFALAYLSWRYVETKFRSSAAIPLKLFCFTIGLAIAFFLLFELYVRENKGVPDRSPQMAAIELRMRPNQGFGPNCDYAGQYVPRPECVNGLAPSTIMVWGDSIAAHLVGAVLASDVDARIVQATKSSCAPLVGFALISTKRSLSQAETCQAFNATVMSYLKSSSVRKVIISMSLMEYLDPGNTGLVSSRVVPAHGQLVFDKLLGTIREIERLGIDVLFVSPPPTSKSNAAACLAKATIRNRPLDGCRFSVDEFIDANADALKFMERLEEAGVAVEYLHQYICDKHVCRVEDGGAWIYRDGVHLSYAGSEWVGLRAKLLRRFIKEKPAH